MKIDKEFNGTIIGGIFTVISFLLTFTFIIPVLSVLPGASIESIMSSIVNNEPYSNVGQATIITHIVILLISILLIFIKSRKSEFSNNQVVAIMLLSYFLFHSLGFYIYWATSLNYRSDGQLIFAAAKSFPLSSFGFVCLGMLIDFFKLNSNLPLDNQQDENTV